MSFPNQHNLTRLAARVVSSPDLALAPASPFVHPTSGVVVCVMTPFTC